MPAPAVTVSRMAGERSRSHSPRVTATAARLRLDSALGGLSLAFADAGIRILLLKGPSLQQWLYSDDTTLRSYLDIDLLVHPDQVRAAEGSLTTLGYARDYDDRSLPEWWREHASAWLREDDGVTVDLHRTLPGARAASDVVFSALARSSVLITVGKCQIPALGLAGRALHVALHAAHHGVLWERPVTDLQLALEKGDDQLWRAASDLALELDAVDAFATGLRLTAAGRELAARLELSEAESVDAALRASTPPPVALGFEQLASAGNARARLAIVWHKLFPPADFIRHWDPRAEAGRIALLRAYVRRPVWLLQRAPEGFRAWRRARLDVKARPDTRQR